MNSDPSQIPSALKIHNRERIPAGRYYDETFFKLENERLWPRVWQMACRLEEIPNVGDWVEYKILDRSVIVVRAKSGVKAFHNACRHRGVELASGHGSCEVQGFICPFHGWRWNLEGQNTFVLAPQMFSEENLEAADLNLVPCRVETWGGCAFINFDDEAPALLDCIGPFAARHDPRNVDKLRVEWWRSAVLPTNWKLAAEAFMESYHVMRTHPELQATALPVPGFDIYAPPPKDGGAAALAAVTSRQLIEGMIRFQSVLSEGMAGMIHANDVAIMNELIDEVELPEDPMAALMAWQKVVDREITARNRARGVPYPDLTALAEAPISTVQFAFPNFFMLPMYGNVAAYRIRPLSAETCLFEIWSLVLYPEDEVRDRPLAPEPLPHDSPEFPLIPRQDYSNLPRQQRGLHAKGFEYMRLSRRVEGMISNYQRLIDGFLEGVDHARLAKATQVASGELDDPIKDIGF